MKITDAMVEKARTFIDERVTTESVKAALHAVVNGSDFRAELLREIAEELSVAPNESEDLRTEPQEIGARVIDFDNDVWTKIEGGWLFRDEGTPRSWREVRCYEPLTRLP